MRRTDVRLYALLDPATCGGHRLDSLAREVVAGGATLLQLRDKQGEPDGMVTSARAIMSAVGATGVPLLINDRVDVAIEAGAYGVHLGQDDCPVEEARAQLGPDAIIGLTIQTVAQAEAAPTDLLDYVCVGGVFATGSKDNPNPPIGVRGLRRIVDVLRARAPVLPIAAIAGIDKSNAGEVIAAGADGIAVISALSLAGDPGAAARALRGIVDAAIAHRAELAIAATSATEAP